MIHTLTITHGIRTVYASCSCGQWRDAGRYVSERFTQAHARHVAAVTDPEPDLFEQKPLDICAAEAHRYNTAHNTEG